MSFSLCIPNLCQSAKRSLPVALALLIGPLVHLSAQEATQKAAPHDLADARIQEIAGWLPDQPTGTGRPVTDRAYWSDPKLAERVKKFSAQAESFLNKEFPAWNDADYLEFSKIGQRPRGEKMIRARHGWLTPLVLAECLENRGRFLPVLNKVLQGYIEEPTWTLPAHDRSLGSYHKTQYDVDLGSSSFGHELAEALYLLGDKLDKTVRQHVETELRVRLFDPVVRSVQTGKGCFWLRGTNNWTAVCLAGVTGAALAAEPDRAQRAYFAAVGEHYAQNFVRGFRPGGYCDEGVGYWGYGFGHYIVLRQELVEATGGKLDLFSDPRSADMALFGVRVQIGKDTVPYFEDCQFGIKPSLSCLTYCNEVFHLGLTTPPYAQAPMSGSIEETLMKPVPLVQGGANDAAQYHVDPLRTYFASTGVLCVRPQPGSGSALGIGIKAGGNSSHSHNDIGSYDIALDGVVPTGDPGGPFVYDGQTFGPQRFTHKLLNSFGHPVPVVAGQLQIEATKAKPVVLSTSFTNERDEIKMDMTSAYAVPALKGLIRTMDYSRAGTGQIAITDEVTFSSANPFEDALITDGEWKQLDERTLMVSFGKSALRVTIQTPDGFTVKAEKVQEMGAPAFTHLSLVLNKPVENGTVRMTFEAAR